MSMDDDNFFDELEGFLNDSVPPPPAQPANAQNVPSPLAAAGNNPSTPGQPSNINQYSPGSTVGCNRGVGGSTPMLNSNYTSNGCSMTTKAVLGERLRNQLGGRVDHTNSGDLKRKLDDGINIANDPMFNKAPKLEIKDETMNSNHGNIGVKTEIKEENTGSHLEAILGLNNSSSDIKGPQLTNAGMEMKQEFSTTPNKPPPTQGGLLQQALMEKRPLHRDNSSSGSLPMFNDNNAMNPGRNIRIHSMNTNGLNGAKPNLDGFGNGIGPQEMAAMRRLKEVSKDQNLNPEARQQEASKIIKENPNVIQLLNWMKNGKYTQRRSSPGSSEFHGPLPSAGCPQKGGGALGGGMNCDQPSNISGMLGNHDPSINGGVTMGAAGQEFTASSAHCTIQSNSPMNNFNEPLGGGMDMHKQRMQQQQWEMLQQNGGQRLQHPPPPNVMCGPQAGGIPTTQFVHGSGMGVRPTGGPTNLGTGYGSHPGGVNNPNMSYQQAPNMIVGHNNGQNWSLIRQPGMNKSQPSAPPPNYPYRTPNVRMERGNIRGISPTIGGYPTQSSGQTNEFRQGGNQAFISQSGPPIRQNFPGQHSSNMNDQGYPIRNPNNCFPNTMYGGPQGSTQSMENGMSPMSVRLGVGFSNGPNGDGVPYQNGGPGAPGMPDYVHMNAMQLGRNGQNGGGNGGGLMVSQGMGSPMANSNEFPVSQQRGGIMHSSNPNMVRAAGHQGSPVASGMGRNGIPNKSPIMQQQLISQGNINGLPQGMSPGGNCSPGQRMANTSNGVNNAGIFPPGNGIPPPNMTAPENEMQRLGPAPPPNYFNTDTPGEVSCASGNNTAGANFNSSTQLTPNQLNPAQLRQQQQQQQQHLSGVQTVQNSFLQARDSLGSGSNQNALTYNNNIKNSTSSGGSNQQGGNNQTESSHPLQSQHGVNGWKQNAAELRKMLLTRLYQTLLKQGDPNARQVAENVEKDAFLQSSTQEMYTMRLAEWLANVFRSTGSDAGSDKRADENKVEDQQSTVHQQGHSMQYNDVNNAVSSQQNQTMEIASLSNVPANDTPSSSTLPNSAVADSTTLQEALSRVGAAGSNIPHSECQNADGSTRKDEMLNSVSGDTSSNNLNNEKMSLDSSTNSTNQPSLSQSNPILADLLPDNSKLSVFDNSQPKAQMPVNEHDETGGGSNNYSNPSNVITGYGKDTTDSVLTPNADPPSNSSNYNIACSSPNSSCSSSISSSTSSNSSPTSITTTTSPSQAPSSTDVKAVSGSILSHPSTPPSAPKSSTSPSVAFSGSQLKTSDSSTATSSNTSGTPCTTTTSSLAFQSPTTFPVPSIDSNENGAKAQHQTSSQMATVISSATTIIPNNTCMTTAANKGSAMVTTVRRPSGKGMNGQQPVTNPTPGQIGSGTGCTITGSTSMSNSTAANGQLSSVNGPSAVGGQNNIQPHSVDSGIGSPRSIASSTLYSPKIQGTSPSLNQMPETLTSSASPTENKVGGS